MKNKRFKPDNNVPSTVYGPPEMLEAMMRQSVQMGSFIPKDNNTAPVYGPPGAFDRNPGIVSPNGDVLGAPESSQTTDEKKTNGKG